MRSRHSIDSAAREAWDSFSPVFETLEGRLLLSGAAPTFDTALPDNYVLMPGSSFTFGVDGGDIDGDALTISAAMTNGSGLTIITSPTTNRYARLHFTGVHFVNADGTVTIGSGDIVAQIFESQAATAATRFITLATKYVSSTGTLTSPTAANPAFYNDVNVHRVIDNFMVQTGDAANGDGTGDSPLADFGVNDGSDMLSTLTFNSPGVLAFAHQSDWYGQGLPETSNSQFFITNAQTNSLNKTSTAGSGYYIFGQLISGWDVLNAISQVATAGGSDGKVFEPPLLDNVQIFTSKQDAVFSVTAAAGFTGAADVTVTLNDGHGNLTEKIIHVTQVANINTYDTATVAYQKDGSSADITNITVRPGETQTYLPTITNETHAWVRVYDVEAANAAGEGRATVTMDPDTHALSITVPADYPFAQFIVRILAENQGADESNVNPVTQELAVWVVGATPTVTLASTSFQVPPGGTSSFVATVADELDTAEVKTPLTTTFTTATTDPALASLFSFDRATNTVSINLADQLNIHYSTIAVTMTVQETGFTHAKPITKTFTVYTAGTAPVIADVPTAVIATPGTLFEGLIATVTDDGTPDKVTPGRDLIYTITSSRTDIHPKLTLVPDAEHPLDKSKQKISFTAPATSTGMFTVTVTAVESGFTDRTATTKTFYVYSQYPGDPEIDGRVATSTYGQAMGTFQLGNILYVADAGNGLELYDITNPASAVLKDTYYTTGEAWGVVVVPRTISGASKLVAFVATLSSGTVVLDVTDPTNVTLLTTLACTSTADTTVPTANITDVTPDPRSTAVNSVQIVFSEAVTGLDLADLTLKLNGGANLLTAAQTVTSADGGITWTLSGLNSITLTSGTYVLALTASGSGIKDTAGNSLTVSASDTWTADMTGPTADIVDVAPDPRTSAIDSIQIVFSEAVTGLDLADLSLKLGGGANLLTGDQTLTTVDNITWTLGNLTDITATSGTYVLALTAVGSDIVGGGHAMTQNASETWVMNTAAPTVAIRTVSTGTRYTTVNSIQIVFNKAVTGLDLADLTLKRDSGSNLLTTAQTLTTTDNVTWTLGNLDPITATAGTYVLTLTAAASGIADAGNTLLTANASTTWTTSTNGANVGVQVVGNLLYQLNWQGGMKVYDITDVSNDATSGNTKITTVTTFDHFTYQDSTGTDRIYTIQYAGAIAISGTRAYLADVAGYFFVLNLEPLTAATPSAPTFVTAFGTGGRPWDLKLSGNTLYVIDQYTGLIAVDVTTPLSPVLLGYSFIENMAWSKLTLAGNMIAVATSTGYTFVDATQFQHVTTLNKQVKLTPSYIFNAPSWGGQASVLNGRMTLPFGSNGVAVVDVANLTDAMFVSTRREFTLDNGHVVTVSVTGPGDARVHIDPNNANKIARLEIVGTTAASSVSITTRGGNVPITDIEIAGSLRSLTGATTDLLGNLTATGIVASVTLHSTLGTHQLNFNTAELTVKATDKLTLNLGRVSDASINTHGVPIASLAVTEWIDTDGNDTIAAPWIGRLTSIGNRLVGGPTGNFAASLDLAGTGLPSTGLALGSVSISGAVTGGVWNIDAGKVGAVRIGSSEGDWTFDAEGAVASIDATGTAGLGGAITGLYFGRISTKGDLTATIGADASDPKKLTSIGSLSAAVVRDVALNLPGGIGSISVVEWEDTGGAAESITAAWLGSLTTTGRLANAALGRDARAGDFDAALLLTGGPAVPARQPTLGTVRIAGSLAVAAGSLAWSVTGDAGAITVNGEINNWVASVNGDVKSLTAERVRNADFTADALGAVKAWSWEDGSITANTVASLTTTGSRGNAILGIPAVTGDFAAQLTVHGVGVAATKSPMGASNIAGDVENSNWVIELGTMAAMTVTGTVRDSIIRSAGSMLALTLGAVEGSQFLAGLSAAIAPVDVVTTDVAAGATIKALNIRGWRVAVGQPAPTFLSDSTFLAAAFGTVSLMNADNNLSSFYLLADTAIKSVKYTDTANADNNWSWKPGNEPEPDWNQIKHIIPAPI